MSMTTPGMCWCVEPNAAFADQEQTAMDIFNKDEVEVIIPLVKLAATQSLILSEDANITPPAEESICEDPLDLAIDQWKDQIIHEEVPKDRATTEPGEADTPAPGSEVKELLSRG